MDEQVGKLLAVQEGVRLALGVLDNAGGEHGDVHADVLRGLLHGAVLQGLFRVVVAVAEHGDTGVAADKAADIHGRVAGLERHVGVVVSGHARLHTGDAADRGGVHARVSRDAAERIAVGDDGEAVQRRDAASVGGVARGSRTQGHIRAAVGDDAVPGVTGDAAHVALVRRGDGHGAGDRAVVDERAAARLAVVHDRRDDAAVDGHIVAALGRNEGVLHSEVLHHGAVQAGKQAARDIIHGLCRRADRHAGDLMVLAVEDAAEIVRARVAHGDPLAPGQVDVRGQDDVLSVEVLILVDRRGECAQLLGGADLVGRFRGALAAVEDLRGIGLAVAAGVAQQGLVQRDDERALERLVLAAAAIGIVDRLVRDNRVQNGLRVRFVIALGRDDLGGNDAAVLHRDGDDHVLALVAAIVGAVLVGDLLRGRIDGHIGDRSVLRTEGDDTIFQGPLLQVKAQRIHVRGEALEVFVQLVGKRLRVQRGERFKAVHQRAAHELAVLVVAQRDRAAQRDGRIDGAVHDDELHIFAVIAVVGLADCRRHARDRADVLRPGARRGVRGRVAVDDGARLAAGNAAQVRDAAVVHRAVGLSGDAAERVAVGDQTEGGQARDAARFRVGGLAVGVHVGVRPAVYNIGILAVADKTAGIAVVLRHLRGRGADRHGAGGPASIHGGVIGKARQGARHEGNLARHIDLRVLHAEVLHRCVFKLGEKAVIHLIAAVRERRALAADRKAADRMAAAVEHALEGLETGGRLSGGQLPGQQGDVRAQGNVLARVVRLAEGVGKAAPLLRRHDDPGVFLRAGAGIEYADRILRLLIGLVAEQRLAAIEDPAVPGVGAQRFELRRLIADVIAGQPFIRRGHTGLGQSAVHRGGKALAAHRLRGDVLHRAVGVAAQRAELRRLAVDHGGGAGIKVAIHDHSLRGLTHKTADIRRVRLDLIGQ